MRTLSSIRKCSLFNSELPSRRQGSKKVSKSPAQGAIERLEDRILLTTTLVQGDASETANRIDLVILGEGYTASEIGPGSTFEKDTQDFLDFLFDPTRDFGQSAFPRYEEFFNVWRIDLASAESGADIPAPPDTTVTGGINATQTTLVVADASEFSVDLPFVILIGSEELQVTAVDVGTNTLTVVRGFNGTTPATHGNGANVVTLGAVSVNTVLDATYRFGGASEDVLNVDQFLAASIARVELFGTGASPEMGVVLVNSDKFGGAGGGEAFAVFAAQDAASRDLGLREMMRNFSNLGLENDDGDPANVTQFMGTLTGQPNLSTTNTFTPWNRWNGVNQPGIGVISAFEGALGADTDIFRPAADSKLRTLGNPFDAVAREAMVLDFYDFVNPLDGHTTNATTITDPTKVLFIDAVGDVPGGPVNDIFEVFWRIDGQLVFDPITGQVHRERSLRPSDFGFTTGSFVVTATISDLAGRRFGNGVDLVRNGTSKLSQSVTWQASIPIVQAPTLVTPLGITVDPLPTFQWTPNDSSGQTWELRVFDIATGDRVITELGLPTTSFTPTRTLLNDTFISGNTYRWTVRGIAADGTPGDYSNGGIFTVRSEAPTLQGPLNPTADVSPTFMWSGVEAAVGYDLMVNDLTNGAPIVGGNGPANIGTPVINVQDIVGMQYTDPKLLQRGKTFEWMVRPVFAGGLRGTWSQGGRFSTEASLETPIVLTPIGPGQSVTPNFTWSGVEGAARYDLWVNDLTDGTSGVIRETNLTTMNFSPTTPLADNHRYLVTVRAIGEDGLLGRFASHREFSVNTSLARPVLQSPVGANESSTPKFQWTPIPGAVAYDLWVNNLTTRQSQVIREKNLTATMFTPTTPLDNQNQYIATVRAVAADGSFSEWAPHRRFTVGNPLATPLLLSPKGNGNPNSPEFKWSSVTNAVRYELWVNDLTTGQQAVIRRDDLTGTSYIDPTPLVSGRRYVYTVRAIDATGNTSLWALHRQFSVGTTLSRPFLISPIGSTTDTTPTFEWTVVVGAVRYEIRVNNLTTGESSVIQNSNVVGTQYTDPTPLTVGHTYLWTVRAFDANGNFSDWAPHRSFRVQGVALTGEAEEITAELIPTVDVDVRPQSATLQTERNQEELDGDPAKQPVAAVTSDEESSTANGSEAVIAKLPMEADIVAGRTEVPAVADADVDLVMAEWPMVDWWERQMRTLGKPRINRRT